VPPQKPKSKPRKKPKSHWGRAKAPRDLSPGLQKKLHLWMEKLGKQEKIHAEKILSHPETKTALGRLLSNSKRRGSPFYFLRSILTACVRCSAWEAAYPKLTLNEKTVHALRRVIPEMERAFLNEETRITTSQHDLYFRALLVHSSKRIGSGYTIGEISDKQIIDALKVFTDERVIEALKVFIGGIGTYGPSSKKKFHSDILLLNLDKMIREHLGDRPLFASIAELMMATFGIDWDQKKVRNRLKYLRRTGMDKMEYPSVESPSLPSPLDIPEPENGVKTLT